MNGAMDTGHYREVKEESKGEQWLQAFCRSAFPPVVLDTKSFRQRDDILVLIKLIFNSNQIKAQIVHLGVN